MPETWANNYQISQRTVSRILATQACALCGVIFRPNDRVVSTNRGEATSVLCPSCYAMDREIATKARRPWREMDPPARKRKPKPKAKKKPVPKKRPTAWDKILDPILEA